MAIPSPFSGWCEHSHKKADKSSCVIVWDRNDYIAEAEKQLNNKSVYKNVTFKEKILQDLDETSNDIF